jgi:hypothetical protein
MTWTWLLSTAFDVIGIVLLWRIYSAIRVLRDTRVTPQTLVDFLSK